MNKSWKWMGNSTLEYGIQHSYHDKNFLALAIYTKTIFRVQQERSYYLNCVQKEDIWDSRNAFKNEVTEIIL